VAFEQILGRSLLIRALENSLSRGEVGHAYLFSGPTGSGKKTTALLFTQALNCTGSNPPCGECSSCRRTASGNHPNVFHIQPQGASIKIEQLRELKENLYYLPAEGFKKVCLLYDADLLTLAAGNSLLKILEEPPADLVFLLLSSRPWALLPTILSRCIHFPLRPLTDEEIGSLLEEKDVPPGEKELLVLLAEGVPGRALELLAQDSWKAKLNESEELMERIDSSSPEELLPLAEELSRKDDLLEIISALSLVFRRRLHSLCSEYSEKAEAGKLLLMENKCRWLLELQSELQENVNQRLALEVFLLKTKGVV